MSSRRRRREGRSIIERDLREAEQTQRPWQNSILSFESKSNSNLEEKKFLLATATDLWREAQNEGSVSFDFVSPDVGESRFVPAKDPALKFDVDGVKYTTRMTYESLYVEDEQGLGVAHSWRGK
jgi:hypothetical protein